jgi:2-aminoethylphosphonate-pyruvate transaminase
MPYADLSDTARRWATDPAIDLWVVVAPRVGDHASMIGVQLGSVRWNGMGVALLAGTTEAPSALLREQVDRVVPGPPPPSPRGIVEAAWAAGLDDLRRVGVIADARAGLDAGHRAGAGAIVGIAASSADRRALLPGQPDVIVAPDGLASAISQRWGPARAHRERILLNPGPTVASDRVHRAIAGPDLCHREPEYTTIAVRTRRLLLEVAEAPVGWEAVLLAGSGTSAMEAMVGGAARPGRRLLCVRNGTYGDRMATMADRAGIPHTDLPFGHTEPADAAAIAAALDADPTIDAVTIVQHETTTGLLNPIAAVAAETRARGVLLAVDAISAFGSELLPLREGGIDLVAGTSNKCLHGLPGCAFVLLSPAAIARVRSAQPRSIYLDLAGYLAAAERDSVPFTPSVPAVYGLLAALEELLDEGVEERRSAYRSRIDWLDGELARLGLEPAVAPEHRSASVRAVPLPPGVAYPELHDRLKAAGYVIYAGQGSGAADQFRACLLGTVTVDALRPFITELETILASVPA